MSLSILLSASLVISSLVCLSSNSWLVIWAALEMNTLSFTTMMLLPSSQKESIDSSLKYFIIQSVASAILVTSMSTQSINSTQKIIFTGGALALLTKLASSPFHSWFLDITNKTNMKNATILMTWQKLAPLYLSIFISKSLILMGIVMSLITGSLSQLNKQKLMQYMALSSVFNLSWMLIAILSNMKITTIFVTLYWSSVVLTMWLIKVSKISNNLKEMKNLPSWVPIIVSSNLSGLPPSMGFLAKWMLISQLVSFKATLLITTLLISSTINFFIYTRMFLTNLSARPNQTPNQPINPSTKLIAAISLMSFIPTTMILSTYRDNLK